MKRLRRLVWLVLMVTDAGYSDYEVRAYARMI